MRIHCSMHINLHLEYMPTEISLPMLQPWLTWLEGAQNDMFDVELAFVSNADVMVYYSGEKSFQRYSTAKCKYTKTQMSILEKWAYDFICALMNR